MFTSYVASDQNQISFHQVLGMNTCTVIHLIFFVTYLVEIEADVDTMTDKIIKDILKDYNPNARPAGQVSDKGVTLGINIVPLHVNVNSESSTLNSHVWFVMK